MNKEEIYRYYNNLNKKTIKEINNHKDNDWFLGKENCNCSFCLSLKEQKREKKD